MCRLAAATRFLSPLASLLRSSTQRAAGFAPLASGPALELLLVTALLAPACNAAFGIDDLRYEDTLDTSPVSCDSADDCPGLDEVCRHRICEGGTCGFEIAVAGTLCTLGICDGQGSCVPTGGPCQSPADCGGGFCVDGRCCDTSCEGDCEVCDLPEHSGICTPHPAGSDPSSACEGGACDGQGNCFVCGAGAPAETGACPAVCDQCVGGECQISCGGGTGDCSGGDVVCPDGFSCAVTCQTIGCVGITIQCPQTGQSCRVDCVGAASCKEALIQCSPAGPCEVQCSADNEACSGTQLLCGAQLCSASCQGASAPSLDCGSSCSCTSSC